VGVEAAPIHLPASYGKPCSQKRGRRCQNRPHFWTVSPLAARLNISVEIRTDGLTLADIVRFLLTQC
jgi:hypothetical protein